MNAEDRIALMFGRAVMRSERLADELRAAQRRIAELEAEVEAAKKPKPRARSPRKA